MISEAQIQTALKNCLDPHTGRDWLSLKAVRRIQLQPSPLVVLGLPYAAASWHEAIAAEVAQHLTQSLGESVQVQCETHVVSHMAQRGLALLPGVKNVIAVASGKGGVGKSTTAANLALALAAEGARVGLLDADIYGPSQPNMMGLTGQHPESLDGKTMLPLLAHGVQTMSIGYLIDAEQPMVWRGPMVTQALLQLIQETQWDNVDYLVVDMPPGTGDVQLTLSQKVPVTGAVIVTTPQDIALIDARKGLRMFEKVGVPILGVVENMSLHVCSHCGHAEPIFGEGGGAKMSQDYQVELLAQLPLNLEIRLAADAGQPTVVSAPQSAAAGVYRDLARRLTVKIALLAQDHRAKFPKIVIQNT